jgi:hypothetical protein
LLVVVVVVVVVVVAAAVLGLVLGLVLVVWILQMVRSHGSESPYWDLASVIPQLIGKVLTSTSKTRLARFWIHAIAKRMWRSLIEL